jgi:hypothetical protein
LKNKIPIDRFWQEYEAYSHKRKFNGDGKSISASLIRVMCWYRKKLLLNLIWLIPLCLFIGWTIGFYVGIPKHIQIDTTDKTITDIHGLLDKAMNISKNLPSCSYINTTIYADYGYGDYKTLLSEIRRFNQDTEWRTTLLNACKDKVFCDCKQNSNPIIETVLNPNNKTFCVWNTKHCGLSERDIRNLVHSMQPLQDLEITRWE